MRWKEIGEVDCSVARALSVVGDRWTLLVLRDAFLGVRRFEDFRANTGASRPLLTERLATLVEHGVLRRVRYQERPERYEYRLTEKGVGLYPVIVSLLAWGDRWMAGDDGPPVRLRHETCGHTMTPELACPDCGETIDPRDVRPTLRSDGAAGPGAAGSGAAGPGAAGSGAVGIDSRTPGATSRARPVNSRGVSSK